MPSLSIGTSLIITAFLFCLNANGINSSHDINSKCKWQSAHGEVGLGAGGSGSGVEGDDRVLSCELHNMNDFSKINLNRVRKLDVKCANHLDNDLASVSGDNLNFLNIVELRLTQCQCPHLNQFNFSTALQSVVIVEGTASEANRFPLETSTWNNLRSLRTLELSRHNLKVLPKELLICHLPNLEKLSLRDNSITELSAATTCPDATTPISSRMKVLDLSKNRLSTIRNNEFSKLTNLHRLQLEDNSIRHLNDLSFWDLDKLEVVNVSGNRLTQLPQNVFAMNRNLLEIHLSNNSLAKLTYDNLKNLNKLSVLDLSHNQLITNSFNDKLVFNDLTQLRILNLSHNLLTRLNEQILSKLINLQIINLEHNSLADIGENTFHANANLKIINLAHNKLKRLSENVFSRVPQLNQLYLEMNSLTSIHAAAFGNLVNLIELNLNGNNLQGVPPVFASLKSLKSLDLGKNQIREIESANFQGLTSLMGLRLVDNFVTRIGNNSFRYLPALHVLNVASNQIAFIESTTFSSNIQKIHAIRLDNNSLTDLAGVFPNLKSLIWLNVSDNRIATFDYNSIPASLEWLDMHANSISKLTLAEADAMDEDEGGGGGGGNSKNSVRSKLSSWNLKYLDVSQNKLKAINEFSLSDNIEVLNLNDNQVEEIAANTFQNKLRLEKVFVMRNQLRQLDKNAIRVSRLTRHQSPQLSIAENPFHCDCHMEYLQDINTHSNYMRIVDLSSLQCTLNNRDEINGRRIRYPLHELKPDEFLCNYDNHCFQLCHCCDYVACDCKMMCPDNCKCFYDNMWQANIVNCARTLLNGSQHWGGDAGHDHLSNLKNIPMDATVIHLDGNKMFNLINHIFIGKKKLEILYLNHSNIYSISNKTFLGIQNLRVLHLDQNYLKHIHANEFSQLSLLQRLYLQSNELAMIESDTFSHMKSLALLDLRNNKLKNFHFMFDLFLSASTPSWKQIESLLSDGGNFANNRWVCNCDLIQKFSLLESVAISADGEGGGGGTAPSKQVETTKLILKNFKCTSLFDKCRQPHTRLGSYEFRDDDDDGRGGGSGNNYLIEKQLIGGKYVQIIAAVMISIIATALLITLICIFRINFNLWFYSKYHIKLFYTEPVQSLNKPYDAYIFYSFFDNDFVHRVLNYELEYQSFKTYLHYGHRNAKQPSRSGSLPNAQPPPLPPLNDIQTNMSLIEQSKRLIILITINFLQEELCNPNYRNYFKNIIFDGDNGRGGGEGGTEIIIIIAAPLDIVMLEPIFNLLLKKKQNNTIFWGEKHFWLKLHYLMPQRPQHSTGKHIQDANRDYEDADNITFIRNNLKLAPEGVEDESSDGEDVGLSRNLNSKQKNYPKKELLLHKNMQQHHQQHSKLTAQSYLNEQTGHVYTTISDIQPALAANCNPGNHPNGGVVGLDENKKAYFV